MRRIAFFSVVAAFCLVGASFPSPGEDDVATIEERLFEVLGADRSECPETVYDIPDGRRAACAKTDLPWGGVKKRIRKFVKAFGSDDAE